LTTKLDGEFHITIPNHQAIRVGTLTSILKLVAAHHKLSVEQLVQKLGL